MVGHRGNCVLILPHTAPLLPCRALPHPTGPCPSPSKVQGPCVHGDLHPGVEWSGGRDASRDSRQSWVLRRGSSRPPSWLSSPSQPVLYLDIDNPNSSPNQPVMDSTRITLFIYHFFRLQSSVPLQSPSLASALSTHLSFFGGGQRSSASYSFAAVRPLLSTSRQTRWFKPDERGDLVLFSPNGAALEKNKHICSSPSLLATRSRHTVLREQRESTSLFLCLRVCVCLQIRAHVCAPLSRFF